MAQDNEINVQLRLTEDTDEGSDSFPRATLNVRAVDADQNHLSNAQITVTPIEANEGPFEGEGKSMGMATTFEDVPLPAEVSATSGSLSGSMEVTESDVGSDVANF